MSWLKQNVSEKEGLRKSLLQGYKKQAPQEPSSQKQPNRVENMVIYIEVADDSGWEYLWILISAPLETIQAMLEIKINYF